MDALTIISILFCLVLIYFLGSTLVSMILELWNHLRKGREKFLESQLTDRLGADAAKSILNDPLVSGQGKKAPKKIHPDTFGAVASSNLTRDKGDVCNKIVDAAKRKAGAGDTTGGSTADSTVNTTGDNSAASTKEVPSDPEALSDWYNNFSEEMSSEFKSSLRIPSLVVSTIIVVLLNLDTLNISRSLWENPATSTEIFSSLSVSDWSTFIQTDSDAASGTTEEQLASIMLVLNEFDSLQDKGLPIGWHSAADLGLVKEDKDTSTTFRFQLVTSVDTSGGNNDSNVTVNSSTAFKYLPPSGQDAFLQDAEIKGEAGRTTAIFGTTVPNPEPILKEENGTLLLNYANVFDALNADSMRSVFKGINNDIYTFDVAAHLSYAQPGVGKVFVENIKTINFVTIIGWLISIICIGMGAPFWYDILKKLINLGTGKAP